MEKDFIFIDDETDGKKRVFHKQLFYSYLKLLIEDFFNVKLEENKIHKGLLNYLNSIQNAGDVYFLTTEVPSFWALGIIQNKENPNMNIMPEKKREETEFYKKFLIDNKIQSFVEEVD